MISELWRFYTTAMAVQSIVTITYRHRDELEKLHTTLCTTISAWKQHRRKTIDKAYRDFDEEWQVVSAES